CGGSSFRPSGNISSGRPARRSKAFFLLATILPRIPALWLFFLVRFCFFLCPIFFIRSSVPPVFIYTNSVSTETLNSLARASSSYLRSSMHQPVQWHEWGPEAVEKAKKENKPILLDIGAVWCHWCHVLDRESYEDPEIASLTKQNLIAR